LRNPRNDGVTQAKGRPYRRCGPLRRRPRCSGGRAALPRPTP